jgi:hypothetical protein
MVRMAQRLTPHPAFADTARLTSALSLKGRGTALAVLLCVLHAGWARAEQQKESRPVAAILAELDSDDFDTREKAERELRRSGAATLPTLRAALENSPTVEVKTRLARIIPFITIEAESDPNKLMLASAEAAAKAQFAIAARGYSRAGLAFGELSQKTKDTTEFADLRVKQADAARRMQLMAVAGRSDKRVGEALAAIYPKLNPRPAKPGEREIGLRINDTRDMDQRTIAGLDELIKAIVDVESASSPMHSMEEQNGKLIIMTVPSVHELISELLSEIRKKMKSE